MIGVGAWNDHIFLDTRLGIRHRRFLSWKQGTAARFFRLRRPSAREPWTEITNLDWRYHDRLARLATLARTDANRNAHRFQTVQHEDRRIVEPEILHRFRDLSILDQIGSVASQAGEENRACVDRPKIPEACYQQTTLSRANQVIE